MAQMAMVQIESGPESAVMSDTYGSAATAELDCFVEAGDSL